MRCSIASILTTDPAAVNRQPNALPSGSGGGRMAAGSPMSDNARSRRPAVDRPALVQRPHLPLDQRRRGRLPAAERHPHLPGGGTTTSRSPGCFFSTGSSTPAGASRRATFATAAAPPRRAHGRASARRAARSPTGTVAGAGRGDPLRRSAKGLLSPPASALRAADGADGARAVARLYGGDALAAGPLRRTPVGAHAPQHRHRRIRPLFVSVHVLEVLAAGAVNRIRSMITGKFASPAEGQ